MKNTYFRTLFTCLVCVTLFAANAFSQTNYQIKFQEKVYVMEENSTTFGWSSVPSVNGGHYVWLQFYSTPTQHIQDLLQNEGIEFIGYQSSSTYLAFVPNFFEKSKLSANGVRSIRKIEADMKQSASLRKGDRDPWAVDGSNILVTAVFYPNISETWAKADLASKNFLDISNYKSTNVINLSIAADKLSDLVNLPYIQYVEQIAAPAEKEDNRGRNLHRANSMDTQTPAGRNYTGAGIGVMVRDDGIVGPHIDFEGRIDNTLASNVGPTHGDGVAGILTGAGNLDPLMRGMAAGANLFVVNFVSSFLDGATTSLINSGAVQITNSSYGEGCNGGYTTNAVNVDQQMNNNPSLLHVFSAGNSGTSNCNYGAGAGWGNITGGHKQGKNVIATANLFFDGALVNSSSRGPAHDGRIKPDIAANGQNQNSTNENNTYMSFGGTSGASPGIAGISAQLYEAYADANAGAFPKAALIKATLLNTANDLGNVGPDFRFGWGVVNGLRAVKLIEDNRFLSATISQGVTTNHLISVPAGTKQVRFMVYWNDRAGLNGASTALVNDLDLTVSPPSGSALLPWVLNPTPNVAALNSPATNGVDRLNNMEQVLINNPVAGTYTVNINGFNVPFGPQEYFIVYEIIEDDLTVTYPNMGESFVPGETESIHWDATNITTPIQIEFSINNGASWNSIATVSSATRTVQWLVPNSVTGSARIRVKSGALEDVSDDVFSIARLVTGQLITQVCPDEVTVTWDALVGAESYDVYFLGSQFMEVVGSSTTNVVTIPITNPNTPIWYAVVAKNATLNWESRRTIASFNAGGILNCSLPNDLELTTINNNPNEFSSVCSTGSALVSVDITNVGTTPISNFQVVYQINTNTPVTETFTGTIASGQLITYTFNTPASGFSNGTSTLSAAVVASGDPSAGNNSQTLSFTVQNSGTSAPFVETFDVNGLSSLWSISNPDDRTTWTLRPATVGSTGASTNVMYFNHFVYDNATGEEDMLTTEVFTISGSVATLTFDLAKANYSATLADGLTVEISTDCGATFSTIYDKSGATLATVSNRTTNWTPISAGNWRNETVDISAYSGENAIFRFTAINGFGNGTFLDNINITSNLNTIENTQIDFQVFPNPTNGNVSVLLSDNVQQDVDITITNQLGQVLETRQFTELGGSTINLDLSNYASGIYFIGVSNGSSTQIERIIKN